MIVLLTLVVLHRSYPQLRLQWRLRLRLRYLHTHIHTLNYIFCGINQRQITQV